MRYYENSMRYAKFLLIFVIFLAIIVSFVKNHAISLYKNKPVNNDEIIEKLKEENAILKQNYQAENPEEMYVNNRFKEYLSTHQNVPVDNYEEIKEQIRKEFREQQDINPVVIQYSAPEKTIQPNVPSQKKFQPNPTREPVPSENFVQNNKMNNNQPVGGVQEVPEENVPLEQIVQPLSN